MKRILVPLLLCCLALCPVSAQVKPGISVVKITCSAGGKEWVGTGFAWEQPTRIVTALHVAAGCAGIEVYSEGLKKGAGAKLVKAFIASDLALLELEKSIGLTPVKTGSQADPAKNYVIWGYPQQVRTMQGDELRFSRVLKEASTLEDIMTSKEHQAAVGNGGYPSLHATILRIGSTIQPGHSGAPIFNDLGEVVAIGDGGLHGGIRSINWAIPTRSLQALVSSQDELPKTRPKQVAQFSVEKNQDAVASPIRVPGLGLRHVFSSTLGHVLATASDNEKDGIASILKLSKEVFSAAAAEEDEDEEEGISDDEAKAILNARIDVYQDSATGATLALPSGIRPSFNQETRMLTASSTDGHVTVFMQILRQGGKKALREFETFLQQKGNWKSDPEFKDEKFEEDGMLQFEKMRYEGEDIESPERELFYSLNVDGEAFLGVATIEKDIESMDEKAMQEANLLDICIELAGFSLD